MPDPTPSPSASAAARTARAKPSSKRTLWLVLGALAGLLVAVVGGVLFLVLLPRWAASSSYGKLLLTRARLAQLDAAVRIYHERHDGRWPADLGSVVAEPECKVNDACLIDPWNRPFLYNPIPEPGSRPRIYTLGSDGVSGGTGNSSDLDNFAVTQD